MRNTYSFFIIHHCWDLLFILQIFNVLPKQKTTCCGAKSAKKSRWCHHFQTLCCGYHSLGRLLLINFPWWQHGPSFWSSDQQNCSSHTGSGVGRSSQAHQCFHNKLLWFVNQTDTSTSIERDRKILFDKKFTEDFLAENYCIRLQ